MCFYYTDETNNIIYNMSSAIEENSIYPNAGFVICPEDLLKFISETVPNATRSFDCCFVPMGSRSSAYYALGNNLSTLLQKMMKLLINKGIECRFITEITAQTLYYWKEFINKGDLRHINPLKASFAVCDGEQYWGFTTKSENLMPNIEWKTIDGEHQLLLYSNNKLFVEMQQFLFDNLWNSATPAKHRIVQIERDLAAPFVNLTTEPEQTFREFMTCLETAIYEILIILPSIRAARSIGERGILDSLGNAVQKGIDVKILIHVESGGSDSDSEVDSLRLILKEKSLDNNMNYLYRGLDSQDIIIVVDQAISFSFNIGNDFITNGKIPMIVSASCSNDDSALSFNVSMFESLWIQSEFEKQNKIKQVYFQMFKGLKLKDEKYNRKWTSAQDLDGHDHDK